MSLEGTQAPEFNLAGSDGKQHCLSDYKGKTIVLYFYPRDNTPGCTKEACAFRENYQTLLDMGIVIFGISKDSIASHNKFIDLYNLPFVLLSDPDASVMTSYEAFGEKVMYGKKTMGTIRSTVIIAPDGVVKKHWSKVAKADQHPQQVLDFLQG